MDTLNYQNLADSDLFGPLEKLQSVTEKPVTIRTLEHLQLLGTVTGPQTVARAIIKNKTTQTSQIYKIHDWIDDAQLIKVSRHEAILQRNRQYFTLERTSETSPSSTPSATNRVITQTTSPAAQPIPPGRNHFTDEIEVVLKAATITSASQTHPKQAKGLMLSRINRFLSAQAAGFREGDIIQSINGHEILSKQQMFQVLQKAKTEPSIDIEIFREGQTILLSFEQE